MTFCAFDHDDHRALLRAWIDAHPARSQSYVARRVGVSRSTVAMVLAGERDIGLAAAAEWARAMELGEHEQAYFQLLVRADSPISLDLRRQARAQAAALRDAHRARRPTLEQARLLGLWYVPVILELTRTAAFRLDATWLAERIWPRVEPDEMAETLDALLDLGILYVQDDAVVVDPRPLSTPPELSKEMSRIGRDYHRAQLRHAASALDAQPPDRRHVGSLAVAVEAARIPALMEALHRFQLEVIEPFRARESADTVVQLSVQMFVRSS